MPELPEVETIRRGLAELVCGRTIADVAVHHPRAIRHVLGGEGEFRSEILGRTIIGLGRRGKFLWLNLADPAAATASASSVPTSQPAPQATLQAGDQVVVVHLGMSGQMLIKDSNANSDDPKFKHCRIQVRFDDDTQLWFVDQRTFGYWLPTQLVDAGLGLVPETADHIARDLLDPELKLSEVASMMHSKTLAVKKLLLNQEIIAGIGNIYADEMLWFAAINPNQPANTLDPAALKNLLMAGRTVMRAAVARGGTSFDGPLCECERGIRIFRCGAPRLWSGWPAMRSVRHNSGERKIYQPVEPLLPPLPAIGSVTPPMVRGSYQPKGILLPERGW